jgi:tetratricopeptide (TPR) repeat protein
VVLHDEPKSDANDASWPVPLLDLCQRRADDLPALPIEPWGATEVARYLESRGVQSDAAALAAISSGRPGFTAELVDLLEERKELGADLSGTTLASLVPLKVDESELDMPDAPPEEGKRKHAGPDEAPQVAYFAALLGSAFPGSLVADMGGWDRESVDDLFDAMPELFEQVQFSQELGTWLYRFRRGGYREGVLQRNDSEPGHELARRVGMFMERFLVPRGYGFVARTSRVYAEHGARGRASLLRAQALGADTPDAWGLANDTLRYFDEVRWPDAMRRVVLQNLLDRLVASGPVANAEALYKEAEAFATRTEDKELTAWLLFAGSRLDARRSDLFRARERARDAIKMYEALEAPGRVAELHNHLAGIELQDGNANAALEQAGKAIEIGKVKGPDGQEGVLPGVFAHAEHVRAAVARGAGKLDDAIKHFRQANDVASQAGMGALALEAGLGFGEANLAKGETQEARDALERCAQIARQLRNGPRERNALELLAQAEGRLGHADKALPHAARVLELSQALKLEGALPFDLYHLGFFWLLNKKPSEALVFFRRASERIGAVPAGHPVVRELHYHKGVAHLQIGEESEGVDALRKAVPLLTEAKDHRKVVNVLDNLATVEKRGGRLDAARKLLAQAEDVADKAGLKNERRALRKKIEEIDTPTA